MWEFRKLGLPYLGVLIIRILLFRVLYWGPLFSERNLWDAQTIDCRWLLGVVLASWEAMSILPAIETLKVGQPYSSKP